MSALRLGSQFRRAERGRAGSEGTGSPEESGGLRAVDSAAPAAGADLYAPDSVCGVGGSEGTPTTRGAPSCVARFGRSLSGRAGGTPTAGERGQAALARDSRGQRLPECGSSWGGRPGASRAPRSRGPNPALPSSALVPVVTV